MSDHRWLVRVLDADGNYPIAILAAATAGEAARIREEVGRRCILFDTVAMREYRDGEPLPGPAELAFRDALDAAPLRGRDRPSPDGWERVHLAFPVRAELPRGADREARAALLLDQLSRVSGAATGLFDWSGRDGCWLFEREADADAAAAALDRGPVPEFAPGA